MAAASAEEEEHDSVVDPVAATIHTIAELHARAEQRVDRPQRAVETVTALLGRPGFLYFSMGFVILWIATNLLLLPRSGRAAFDPPPFYWLQGLVSVTALFTTTTVLIAQRRQDRVAERREQLDLQISLLIEQETTKIIGLLEELRRDLPNVPKRIDPEAEQLASATDAAEIVGELERVLEEAESVEQVAEEEVKRAAAGAATIDDGDARGRRFPIS